MTNKAVAIKVRTRGAGGQGDKGEMNKSEVGSRLAERYEVPAQSEVNPDLLLAPNS